MGSRVDIKFTGKQIIEEVQYRLVEDDKVREYVLKIAQEEWSGNDFMKYGNDLYKSKWVLREVNVESIKPNLHLLETERFQKDVRPRIEQVRKMLRMEQMIPPLVLRGSDLLIFDGYARYHVLRERRIKRCLAYVGYRPRESKMRIRESKKESREKLLARMHAIIRKRPGIRPSELNRLLNRAHSVSLRESLIKRGLVRKKKDGAAVRYYPV